ncbi:type I-F CRISPR-associated endoribonuclease Cas6/Csy4 [Paludibacterium paludis]|uniref:Type I-F CRISPR-associated endoribonuclease Cas6/Csy4 n=1 Tax=Paludibacterium paludis TaxID=1225769 RepID=A0A918UBC0_9NEIS|nr:type I-F CRISPR-associated endoribonuclease Cas6/Csy4 [Paludibacterium paludis]GGY23833.1 type I-F CRISPR-associated endoribonuclease Cas6/Csy4 [Paludibacterium paludis]
MDYYLDIRLLPDADFSPPVLMNALYAKLHRVLVTQQRTDIGVSFPGYDLAPESQGGTPCAPSLGLTLRLHGTAAALDNLMARRWLTGFADHAITGNILPVPASTSHIRVLRRQVKSCPARERDRLMRRKNLSLEEACRCIPDSKAKRLDLPFLTVDSSSTGQRFRLFIQQLSAAKIVEGSFNAYGLSPSATLPQW